MADFSVGDQVQIKSGGPVMTVQQLLDNVRVECVWFDDKDNPQERIFKSATLEKYDQFDEFIRS